MKIIYHVNFFLLLNTKDDILKNVGNQTVDFFFFIRKSMAINCLVTDILQNIFLCVQKEIHSGLEQLDGE